MFATVQLYEESGGIVEKLKRLFSGPKIISEKVSVGENEYFYKLTVPVKNGELPYEKLKKLHLALNDGFIFPEGVKVSAEGIKAFQSKYFKDLLLFNTAAEMLSGSVFDPAATLVTLIDIRGVLSSQVKRLAPYASEIRVITSNMTPYRIIGEKMMNECGLSLFISDKLSAIGNDGIIISRESEHIPLSFKGVVITSQKRFLPFAKVLLSQGIKGTEKYDRLCPEGIDREEFFSALCEVCYVSDLRNASHKKLVDIS